MRLGKFSDMTLNIYKCADLNLLLESTRLKSVKLRTNIRFSLIINELQRATQCDVIA